MGVPLIFVDIAKKIWTSIDIDIGKKILKNIDINIARKILKIINSDKGILQNIDIDKILDQ